MSVQKRLLPLPEPTPTQRHPAPSYKVVLRLTHEEAEILKATVARRCLLGLWAPDTDAADWVVQLLIKELLSQQGVP